MIDLMNKTDVERTIEMLREVFGAEVVDKEFPSKKSKKRCTKTT